jgi:hypothetical protein
MRISLRLDPKRAGTLLESLRPDNVDLPPGLEISMDHADGEATFEISGSMKHVIGTADEMLAHAQVALDVVE